MIKLLNCVNLRARQILFTATDGYVVDIYQELYSINTVSQSGSKTGAVICTRFALQRILRE